MPLVRGKMDRGWKRAAISVAALFSLAPESRAYEFSGKVFDKFAAPIVAAQVCLTPPGEGCVATGMDGSYKLTEATVSAFPASYASSRTSPVLRGGKLILSAPEGTMATREWFRIGGDLAEGPKRISANGEIDPGLPASLGAGMGILRIRAPGFSRAWMVMSAGEAFSLKPLDPPRREAAGLGKSAADPAGIAVSRQGYRPVTLSPTLADRIGLAVYLASVGDSILFDGATLKGWSANPAIWSIKDDAIDGKATNGGQLAISKDDFGSFRLVVSSRLPSKSQHLGICFWGSRPTKVNDWGYGNCIDVMPPHNWMWDYSAGGLNAGLPEPKPSFPDDVWNHAEILADIGKGTIRMAVNGVAVVNYTDKNPARLKRGPIGLQIHAGASEVQYKDLVVLTAPQADTLFTLKK